MPAQTSAARASTPVHLLLRIHAARSIIHMLLHNEIRSSRTEIFSQLEVAVFEGQCWLIYLKIQLHKPPIAPSVRRSDPSKVTRQPKLDITSRIEYRVFIARIGTFQTALHLA